MKVQVTGASGFVGRNLQTVLTEQGMDTSSLSLRSGVWQKDLDNHAIAIVHLAGKAHDTSNTSDAAEYFKVNRDLTIELFEAFLASDIRDFFYFSSVKAVADSVDGILAEDAPAKPLTPYGKSKLEAESYLLSKNLPDHKRLFIIRPCMIHGPGNKGNLNLLYKVVEKGLPWPLGAFDNERSFIGIDNLLFLIKAMLEKEDMPSGIYHFADDETISTNEVVRLIAMILEKKPKVWSIPSGMIRVAAQLGDILPLPLNSERVKKLTESYVVSNAKIKQILGIDKLPLTAREGLEKTIGSFGGAGNQEE